MGLLRINTSSRGSHLCEDKDLGDGGADELVGDCLKVAGIPQVIRREVQHQQ